MNQAIFIYCAGYMNAAVRQGQTDILLISRTFNNAIRGKDGQRTLLVATIMNNNPFESMPFLIIMLGIHDNTGDIIPENFFADRSCGILFQHVKTQVFEGAIAPGHTNRAGSECQQSSGQTAQHDWRHKLHQADTAGLHNRNLVIGRQATKRQQNRQQKSHGDGKNQKRRHQVEDHPADISQRYAARYYQIGQLDQAAHQ